jgi:hypothetical protein
MPILVTPTCWRGRPRDESMWTRFALNQRANAPLLLNEQAPFTGVVLDIDDCVALGFGGARDVACAFGIVEPQLQRFAAAELLEPYLRLCPVQRTHDTTQIQTFRHNQDYGSWTQD